MNKIGQNIEPEDPRNIILVCPDCSEKLYPHKGKLNVDVSQHAKLKFTDKNGSEYMWVNVTKADNVKGEYEGCLDNDPVMVECVSYGDTVTFKKEDIFDVTIFSK